MIDSIFVAMSGMLGHERGLNVISNNVSNMNTPGFRGSIVGFADVFNGSARARLASGEFAGQQGQGGGVDASRTMLDLHTVQAQQTGRGLDLSLKGEGFFVVQDETGEIRYTRAGGFAFDEDGVLVMRNTKNKVMSRSAGGQLVPITLANLESSPAKPTTRVAFNEVLSSGNSNGDPDRTIDSLVVYDGNGGKHTLKLLFHRDSTQGGFIDWNITVSEDGADIGTGTLELIGNAPTEEGRPLKITLELRGAGAAEIAFDFDDVQFLAVGSTAVNSTMAVKEQDGYALGTIATQSFDDKGVLKITYSNGQKADGARLVLAQITDEAGLTELGEALFGYRGSRQVALREPADDLMVQSQTLEPSNVDLTTEFSQLILMQRGYQASSQVLSTANDMLQALFDLRGRR